MIVNSNPTNFRLWVKRVDTKNKIYYNNNIINLKKGECKWNNIFLICIGFIQIINKKN